MKEIASEAALQNPSIANLGSEASKSLTLRKAPVMRA